MKGKLNKIWTKPPQTDCTKVVPMSAILDSKFVLTVVAQKDICPHGRM